MRKKDYTGPFCTEISMGSLSQEYHRRCRDRYCGCPCHKRRKKK